jgi:hypothetical protein
MTFEIAAAIPLFKVNEHMGINIPAEPAFHLEPYDFDALSLRAQPNFEVIKVDAKSKPPSEPFFVFITDRKTFNFVIGECINILNGWLWVNQVYPDQH